MSVDRSVVRIKASDTGLLIKQIVRKLGGKESKLRKSSEKTWETKTACYFFVIVSQIVRIRANRTAERETIFSYQ